MRECMRWACAVINSFSLCPSYQRDAEPYWSLRRTGKLSYNDSVFSILLIMEFFALVLIFQYIA